MYSFSSFAGHAYVSVCHTWQVKEMVVLYEVLGIAKLPRSPEPVRLFPPPQNPNEISLLSEVVGPEVSAYTHTHTHTP